MKRVLVAALHHESNSFNPIVAGWGDFRVLRGQELIDSIRSNDSLSGIITTLQGAGYEVIPTVSAQAVPNGLVDKDFFLTIKNEIIEMAKTAHQEKPLDAITLALHGSMRIVEFGEAEGILLNELRALFPNIPIHTSLDMHASLSQAMHDSADGFVGYKTAPHIDCTETGIHAAKLTIHQLETGRKTTSAWVKLPLLIAGEQSATTDEPMISLINRLREVEKRPGVLAASLLMGFPWADHVDSGCAIYLVTDHDQALADKIALELGQLVWNTRKEFAFVATALPIAEATDKAIQLVESGVRPVLLSDSGDNPTAGASSDNTSLLAYLLNHHESSLPGPVIYGGIYDPEATQACKDKLHQEIELSFGAAFDSSSKPLTRLGVVKNYLVDWQRHGFPKGDLAVFSTGGIDIVLAEQHVGYVDPQMYRDLGLEPEKAAIIINKLGYLTPEHEAIAQDMILVLTPGNTNEALETIDYKVIPRSIYPLDEHMEFRAEDGLIKRSSKE